MRFFTMLRFFSFFFFLQCVYAQEVVTIEGFAPQYAGKKLAVSYYEDYLSKKEKILAESMVKADSTFEIKVAVDQILKVKISFDRDFIRMYLAPHSSYDLHVVQAAEHTPNHPIGNELNYYFGGLGEEDINYKIVTFENEIVQFLKDNFSPKKRNSGVFSEELDSFKSTVSGNYEEDTCTFFKAYVKFGIASLDDLPFNGNRNRYEKYDFYIKPETVWYQNDRYMDYIMLYYDKYTSQLSKAVNTAFYDGVVAKSPSMVMQALGRDYALDNLKLRELIMIKMLTDSYHNDEFPETNIENILDSLSNHALFSANKKIAKNIKNRLTDLVPGGKMINFSIEEGDTVFTQDYFSGKHLYMGFLNPNSKRTEAELDLLTALYDKYNNYVSFFTLFVFENDKEKEEVKEKIYALNLPWDFGFIDQSSELVERARVLSFPAYILADGYGYIVQAPALSPRPNNEYETIERYFFNIKKRYQNKD